MRVGINGTVFKNEVTGVAKRLIEVLTRIERIAHDVDLTLFSPKRVDARELGHLPLVTKYGGRERIWRNYVLPRSLKRRGIEVFDSPWGLGLPTRRGVKPCRFLTTYHDTIPLDRPEIRSSKKGLAYRVNTADCIAAADHVVVVSEHTRARILEEFAPPPQKLTVLPNGVGERYRPLDPEEEPEARARLERTHGVRRYALYVGGFRPRKNVERLLTAFASVAARRPEIDLVMVGAQGREFRSHILPLLSSLELERRVHLPGYVPEPDLIALYQSAELLVYPSLFEGFGMPPIEAIACGCPALAHDGSALPETVGDLGALVDMRDVDAISAAVSTLLDSERDEVVLRERSEAVRARFSWDRTARGYLDLYRELAG